MTCTCRSHQFTHCRGSASLGAGWVCEDELYLRRERECIAEYDGGLTREQAEHLAAREIKPQASLFEGEEKALPRGAR